MYYLIDGYNFLFRVETSKGKSLEERRKSFIDFLSEELLPLKGRVAIIFDSAEQIHDVPQCAPLPNLEVIYTPRGKTADAYIIERIEQNSNPKTLTIVTSDNGLTRQCQHLGTKTLSIEAFVAFLANKRRKKPTVKPSYRESKQEMERLRKIFENRLET